MAYFHFGFVQPMEKYTLHDIKHSLIVLSCSRAQLVADCYWDGSSLQIGLVHVFACKHGIRYQIIYGTLLQFGNDAIQDK